MGAGIRQLVRHVQATLTGGRLIAMIHDPRLHFTGFNESESIPVIGAIYSSLAVRGFILLNSECRNLPKPQWET